MLNCSARWRVFAVKRYLILCLLLVFQCMTLPVAAGTNYYLAPAGNDGNDGRSVDTAFRTLERAVDALQGGDTLFIRDGTYRGMIALDVAKHSGTAENPTRILAYEGERPVIKGSIVVENWERHEGDIWKKMGWEGHTQTLFVDFDKAPLTSPLRQVGTAGGKNDSFRGKIGNEIADMVPGSFFCDIENKVLYVWLPDGGDPNQHVIEAGHLPRLLSFNVTETEVTRHVLIRGLSFYHSNSSPTEQFLAAIAPPYNSILENCVVEWMDFGGVDLTADSIVRNCDVNHNGGLGIQVRGHHGARTMDPSRFLITHNRVTHNNWRRFNTGHHAGGMKMIPGAWGTVEYNEVATNYGSGIWFDWCLSGKPIVVRHNFIHHNHGREYDAGIKLEAVHNATASHNLIWNNQSNGVLVFASKDVRVLHNTIVENEGMAAIQVGGVPREKLTMTGARILNNVIADNRTTWDLMIQREPSDRVHDNLSDHNLLFRTFGPLQLTDGGTYTGFKPMIDNLEQWRQQTGHDRHSLNADPRFLVGRGRDWRLASDSPAIGRAVNTSDLTQDTVAIPDADVRGDLGAWPHVAVVSLDAIRRPPTPSPDVWVDDHLPDGAVPAMQQVWVKENPVQFWNWVTTNPVPMSGRLAIDVQAGSKSRHQCFEVADTPPFVVRRGESLSLRVYLEPAQPPREIAIQFKDAATANGEYPFHTRTWKFGGRWGEQTAPWIEHLPNRGDLPQPGAWHELRLSADELGFADVKLTGLSFVVSGGRAVFDAVRRVENKAPVAKPTIPALLNDNPTAPTTPSTSDSPIRSQGPAGSPIGTY